MIGVRWRDGEPEGRCDVCREFWPITTEFWSPSNGVRKCKDCWRAYKTLRMRGYMDDDIARLQRRARNRLSYRLHHRERRAYDNAYKAAHREQARAYNAAYRLAHKADLAAKNKVYRDANRDLLKIKRALAKP